MRNKSLSLGRCVSTWREIATRRNLPRDSSFGSLIMMLLYQHQGIFIYGFNHKLGSIRRDLNQLQKEQLLLGTPEVLSALGYHYTFGIGKSESLMSLATDPLSCALQHAGEPRAFVSQHCGAESAVLHYEANETDIATRNRSSRCSGHFRFPFERHHRFVWHT